MKKLIYLGNQFANPICRDAEKPFADSLGIQFLDISMTNALDKPEWCRFIIDCGWKSEPYIDWLSFVMAKFHSKGIEYVLRIVDDPEGRYDEFDRDLMNLIEVYRPTIISPYKHKYFGKFEAIQVPYHYQGIRNPYGHKKTAILSGFNNPIYPLREQIYAYDNKPDWLEILPHPGYSGRCWPEGKLGDAFVKHLSQYKFMIMTTAQDFELLKYVECAEAGCCPVGEFPSSIFIQLPNELKCLKQSTPNGIFNKIEQIISNGDWEYYAKKYQNFMRSTRSKSEIKRMLSRIW